MNVSLMKCPKCQKCENCFRGECVVSDPDIVGKFCLHYIKKEKKICQGQRKRMRSDIPALRVAITRVPELQGI